MKSKAIFRIEIRDPKCPTCSYANHKTFELRYVRTKKKKNTLFSSIYHPYEHDNI